MLAVTTDAKKMLSEILSNKEVKPEVTLRVVKSSSEDSDLDFIWDKEQQGDQVVKNEEERTVLVIQPDLAKSLEGMTLLYKKTPERSGFSLKRMPSEA